MDNIYKMPRKPEIEPEDLQSQLIEWPSIFYENKLVGNKHPVWLEIKTNLGLSMTASSLHLYVYNNRHQIKSFLENHFGIAPMAHKNERKRAIAEDPDYAVNTDKNPLHCDALDFNLTIPANQFIESLLDKKKADSWFANLHSAIVRTQGLPCAYDYRNGYITKENFKFSGTCSDCKTTIRGESEPIERLEKDLKITVHTFSTRSIPHTKKKKFLVKTEKKSKLFY
ncbi:uncharacterized protein LOC116417995 [Nasonia vitripennis]|uniref:Uncharacterized protein n=1 Tax=Nasonia vitripennis TaxID=7425 RepID=A0A7M7R3T2_NASVI|nr:uncharacterized protein LOC116417995 [Nasonia vitripennis]